MFLICTGVLFLTFYVSVSVYDVFILILMIVAAHEMSEALSYKYAKPGFIMQVVTILVSYAVFKTVNIFSQSKYDVYGLHGVAAYFITLMLMVLIIFVVNMTSPKKTAENVISSIFCLIYPVAIMFFFPCDQLFARVAARHRIRRLDIRFVFRRRLRAELSRHCHYDGVYMRACVRHRCVCGRQ